MKIYTRTGDQGQTALFAGGRVSKAHLRVEAYGHVDELNSLLGICLVHLKNPELKDGLAQQQPLLFELGGELATPQADKQRNQGVRDSDLDWLESDIDRMESELPALKSFILPGGSAGGAYLHLARTVCRRAERSTVALLDQGETIREQVIAYLNRLSDWLFVAARFENRHAGIEDKPWLPQGT